MVAELSSDPQHAEPSVWDLDMKLKLKVDDETVKGSDQRELDKLKLKAERLNKSSSQFAVQHGSLEEGNGDQESSGLKKVAGELISDRDHVNAVLSAVVKCLQ